MARHKGRHGPEEILDKRGSLLKGKLQCVTLKPDERPEEMRWGRHLCFPGQIVEVKTGGTNRHDLGSRLEDKDVGGVRVVARGGTGYARMAGMESQDINTGAAGRGVDGKAVPPL